MWFLSLLLIDYIDIDQIQVIMDPEENRNLKSDLLVENMRLQSKSEALAENTVQNVQPESVVEVIL